MSKVKVDSISWNCRDFSKIVKVKQVMSRIKDLKAKVVFLQETHLLSGDNLKIKKEMAWVSIFSLTFIKC